MLTSLLALMVPSTLLTLLCVGGTILRLAGRYTRRLGTALLATGLVGLAIVLLLPVDVWLLRPLEDRFPEPAAPAHVDGVVVLGGAISVAVSEDRGRPTLNHNADRVVAFAILARTYPTARLVFAGGPPELAPGEPDEADDTRTLLGRLGVAPDRVLYDDQSRTTWENAVNALALAHPKPGEVWILVTSADHMPRAMGTFRAAGWPPMLAWPVAYRTARDMEPSPLEPVSARLTEIDMAAHEWVGLLAYYLEGKTTRLLPGP
jgi:uncharacterized SAM-binding protein YcdF (DUF218 family)